MSIHRFAFAPSYRLAGLLFGVTPRTATVEVGESELTVRYGPWRLRTPLANVGECQVTNGYTFVKTAGPPHLSFVDKGVTFATSSGPGLCVSFREPVGAIDFVGRIRHPAATLTVEDPEALKADLQAVR